MQGFDRPPSQRSAPSPGPGWTALTTPESDSESGEENEDDMLDRDSIPPGPASRGAQTKKRGTGASQSRPRPTFGSRLNMSSTQPVPPAASSSAPSPAELLAKTVNAIGSSQPTRTVAQLDFRNMPPPAFSASQLAMGSGSASSSSKVASTAVPNGTDGSSSISAKPYAMKQTARKSSGNKIPLSSFSQTGPSSTQSSSSLDKGKGRPASTFPDFTSRVVGDNSVSLPSSAPPRIASGSSGGVVTSKARSKQAALSSSDSEDFPDAKQFSATSQASRMPKKSIENLPKLPKRLPQRKIEGDESGKSKPTSSISYSRPPSSTQPASSKPGSSRRIESISAPLPASQPTSSSKTLNPDVLDLSGPEDEEIVKQRLKDWKAGLVRKDKGKQTQRRSPVRIDLTGDELPPTRTQMPRKSMGVMKPIPYKPLSKALASQKGTGQGRAVELVIDLTQDNSDDDPPRVRQTARKSTGNVQAPRKPVGFESTHTPQTVRKSTGKSPRTPVEPLPVSIVHTTRKEIGHSGPSHKPDKPKSPNDPRSPRQTARKSTGQLESSPTPTLNASPQTARKSTGKSFPSQSLGQPRNLAATSNNFPTLAGSKERRPDHDLPKSLDLPIDKQTPPVRQAEGSGSRAFDFTASQPLAAVINAMNAETAAPAPSTASSEPFNANTYVADFEAMDVVADDNFMLQDDAIPEIELAISEVHLDNEFDNRLSAINITDGTEAEKQVSKQITSEEEIEGQPPAIEAELSDRMHVDSVSADEEDEEVNALLFSSRSPSRQSGLSSNGNFQPALPNEGVEVDISARPTLELDGTPPVLTTQMERLDLSSASGSRTPQTAEPHERHSALKEQGLSRIVLPTSPVERSNPPPVHGAREERASDKKESNLSTLSGPTSPMLHLPLVGEIAPSHSSPSSGRRIESVDSSTSILPSKGVLENVSTSVEPPETLPARQLPSPVQIPVRSPVLPSQRDHALDTASKSLDRPRSPEQTSRASSNEPALTIAPKIPTLPRSTSTKLDISAFPQPQLSKSVNALIAEPKPVRRIQSSLLMNAINKASVLNATPGASKASTSSLRGLTSTSSLRSQTSVLSTKRKESAIRREPIFATTERPRSGSASSASTNSTGDLRTIRQIRSEYAKWRHEPDSEQSRRTSVEISDQPTRPDSPISISELNRTNGLPNSEVVNAPSSISSPPKPQSDEVPDKDLGPSRASPETDPTLSIEAPASPRALRKRPRSSSQSGHEPGGFGDTTFPASSRNANKRPKKRFTFQTSSANIPVPSSVHSHSRSSSTDTADDLDLLDTLANDNEVDFNINQRPPEALPEVIESIGREFASVSTYFQAKDLPHKLADVLNGMPKWQWSLYPDVIRQAFESAIMSSTTFEEPDAPYIKVINDFDDDIIPPSEFYYTNLMWHGDNVPPPETSKLKGCDCIGKCDPKNRKCSCLQQAQKTCEEAGVKKGFLYDARGRLRVHNYPIYECNELCGCTEDCWNRVVQAGRKCSVNIVKTETKGWGVFAGRKIPSGSFVGIYSGEIITDEEGERRGHIYNNVGRTYLFDIDFWHLKEMKDDDVVEYTIDAFHAGNFTRFLNHSCDPNCRINAVYINESNKLKPLLAIFTIRDIEAGEELCFSYNGEKDDEDEDEDSGTTATEKKGAVYRKCECGARKCVGRLFT